MGLGLELMEFSAENGEPRMLQSRGQGIGPGRGGDPGKDLVELLPKVKTLPPPGAEGAEHNRGLLIFGGLPTGAEVLGTARNDLSSLERRYWEQ